MDTQYEWPLAVSVMARSNATTWTDVVRQAGELLVRQGACLPSYVTAMRQSIEQFGPYVVLAPGVAMPHARPEDGVLRPGLAVITLIEPVEFGHAANDPVDLIIAFTAHDKDSHVDTLRLLAAALLDPAWLTAVRSAPDDSALSTAIGKEGTA